MTTSSEQADFVSGARKKLGLSQPEFAEKLGLKRYAIIRYERGEPVPEAMIMAIKYLLDEARRNEARRRRRNRRRQEDATAG